MVKTQRCVECDMLFEGEYSEHSKTKEHKLNERVNYILRLMKKANIGIEELTEVIKRRSKTSHHGEIML